MSSSDETTEPITEKTHSSPTGHVKVSALIGSLLLNQFLEEVEIYFVVNGPDWKEKISKMDSR